MIWCDLRRVEARYPPMESMKFRNLHTCTLLFLTASPPPARPPCAPVRPPLIIPFANNLPTKQHAALLLPFRSAVRGSRYANPNHFLRPVHDEVYRRRSNSSTAGRAGAWCLATLVAAGLPELLSHTQDSRDPVGRRAQTKDGGVQ